MTDQPATNPPQQPQPLAVQPPAAPAVPQTAAQLRAKYQQIQSDPELQGALAALKEL